MPALHSRFIGRRRVLQWLASGPSLLWLGERHAMALPEAAALERLALAPRELSLHNLHTGERLAIRYFDDGRYSADALRSLNHLLRDHRSGDVTQMDQRLFDQLHLLALAAQRAPHFEVISGFRSPATNASLREQGRGVASNSLHTAGRAMDVRLAGLPCSRLRDLALAQRRGGVGYYRKPDFVHVDTGAVRSWTG